MLHPLQRLCKRIVQVFEAKGRRRRCNGYGAAPERNETSIICDILFSNLLLDENAKQTCRAKSAMALSNGLFVKNDQLSMEARKLTNYI